MPRAIAGLAAAAIAAVLAHSPADAVSAARQPEAKVAGAITEFSAQQRRRRPATRIEVTPLRRAYRECTGWYAVERRPSGPVIVPHMRCWWARR